MSYYLKIWVIITLILVSYTVAQIYSIMETDDHFLSDNKLA